jgi:hypothetical protein
MMRSLAVRATAVVLTAWLASGPARAQDLGSARPLSVQRAGAPPVLPAGLPESRPCWRSDPAPYFAGAFVGLLGHESGHLLANWALDDDPWFKRVDFASIPWFTIEPGRKLDDREHYFTASAGFNAQFLVNEWLLTTRPNLAQEDDPFRKGVAQFNFWLGMGYVATALAGYGPEQRDIKGMADSLGWSEECMALTVLTPTLLDAYRYKHPDARWARDASRLSKLLLTGLALTADRK